MGRKESMDRGSEEYLQGRRAGVEGTQGEKRKGVAEKTIWQGQGSSDGGGEDGLGATARSLYKQAVNNSGDKLGDKALTER